jgi:hypothetical protein
MNTDDGERLQVSWMSRHEGGSSAVVGCVRCGHPVPDLFLGCKAPCRNCRFLYPAGDCSD